MSDKAIKSVRRIFEILELFDQERRPLPAKEIAKRLDYPLMSAHALLKSIHELGYADFEPSTWCYTPSRTFPELLDWVRDFLDCEKNIIDFMTALNKATKETVNLSRRMETQVKIIHGMETDHAVGVKVKVGTMMPSTLSLTGIASLVEMNDNELDKFFKRLPKLDPDQAALFDEEKVIDILRELKAFGTVTRCDIFITGIGAVCLPIRTRVAKEMMIVGVVGPSDRIRENETEHRCIIKKLAEEFRIDCPFKIRAPR